MPLPALPLPLPLFPLPGRPRAWTRFWAGTTGGTAKFRPTPAQLNSFARWIEKGAIIQNVTNTQLNRWAGQSKSWTPGTVRTCLSKKFGKTCIKAVAWNKTGGFIVAKVDVDASPEISQALGVQSVPTCFLLKEGRPVDAFAGAVSEKQLMEFLAKNGVQPADGGEEEEDSGPIAIAAAMVADGDAEGALAMLKELNDEEALDLDGILSYAELQAQTGDSDGASATLEA